MSREEDFDPSKNPTFNLFKHITIKGTQVGALFGCGILLPILATRGYLRAVPLTSQIATNALTYSSISGIVLADGIGIAKYMNMDQEGLEDRVYRLHYNESQNRCDVFSLSCGTVCALATPFFINFEPRTIVGGFTVGSALGIVAHVLTSNAKGTPAEKMKHELKT